MKSTRNKYYMTKTDYSLSYLAWGFGRDVIIFYLLLFIEEKIPKILVEIEYYLGIHIYLSL